jgi:transposase
MTSYLGIDVSKARLDVLLLREGLSAEAAQFANTRPGFNSLRHFLKKRQAQPVHVCLEATGY